MTYTLDPADAWRTTEPRHPGEPDPRWREDAACRGVETALFFPARGEPCAEAKAICRGCPARDACLAYALEHFEMSGVWGGCSERERRRLRLTRRGAA